MTQFGRPARIRISAASMAGDRRSPFGFLGSLTLHGLIVAGTLFTFTHRLDITDESAPVVPVDLVTLSTKTNVMSMAKPQPRIAPVKPTPVPPNEMKIQAPDVPQEDAEPPPEQAASEPVVKAPPPPAIPKERPKETPKQEKNKFDLDQVAALLNKVAPQAARSNARTGARNVQGFGDQTAMTADLTSMLLSQIKACWSPPVGAPNPEDLIVDFDVELNQDGSVARPPQLLANSSNPYFRAAVEAARRAIYTCAPYKLPQDRYSQWREINPFRFDPRQMMGD